MALTILKRGAKALYIGVGERKARAVQTTLAKWRRKEGPASFLADLITLRKALLLCNNCGKYRLPSHWTRTFDYEELTKFHGQGACDYCREEGPVSLYLAGEGDYWQDHEKSARHVAEVRKREQVLYNKDRRYLIGA